MSIRLPIFRKRKQKENDQSTLTNIPRHVAIIMDGNGRWAKRRGLPRAAGHKEGMETVKKVVRQAVEYNIEALTLYAFSTENWKRPKTEVEFIMKLPGEFLHTYLPELIDNNVQVRTIGDLTPLPEHTKEAIHKAIEQTSTNTGLVLNFALNYGSRAEITGAVNQIVKEVADGQLSPNEITEDYISARLYTSHVRDPDLLIRTSGEVRISNFLLWQIAYSEFYFTDVFWPDFDEEQFKLALLEYQNRKRRYGGI
ncbi:isoprenyl transferase [Salirhabdus salicampi]|uniref:isoprenyl transferase n=1 Tax=Salirhabdus salicampi TaxID=476102 RepID=UPI0020C4B9F2|nr:isoprenyl transferase [Salirhabdus salicampi]MCP8616492.1 isoprenyl transferase [Salirhabdus salicampi]